MYPDETHDNAGRHVAYLDQPQKFKTFDPKLFDGLRTIVASGRRNVKALESANFLSNAVYHSDLIIKQSPDSKTASYRSIWFENLYSKFVDCQAIFIDPDNGLEPSRFFPDSRLAGKSVSIDEILRLAGGGRTVIVYHHQTRRKGGAAEEFRYWSDRLKAAGCSGVEAIRTRLYSSRFFFILNGTPDISVRTKETCLRWGDHFVHYNGV